MAGVTAISPADRLRVYRRFFHELDEQPPHSQANASALRAEMQALEELIMMFAQSDLIPPQPPVVNAPPSASGRSGDPGAWIAELPAPAEVLDMALVADILILSAASPWTVFVAERSSTPQWPQHHLLLLAYVSPSCKRLLGWRPWELVGTPALEACHPDDTAVLRRMLAKEGALGKCVKYRRRKKDSEYVQVQATGRAVGARWFAWVEHHDPGSDEGKKEVLPDAAPDCAAAAAAPVSQQGLDKAKGSAEVSIAAGPKAPAAAAAGQLRGSDLLRGKKILLVEDDAVNRKIGQKLLESMDCRVTVACNGKEALDILRNGPDEASGANEFDLVLMDLLMPVMDGTRAVEAYREWEAEQEPVRKPLVIFAVTANVSDGDMVKCARSGFDEFVSKPLTVDKLLERLSKGIFKSGLS